jgi:hypothetical protein
MSGRWPVVEIIAESLSQHDEKHVLLTLLSGIRVIKIKNTLSKIILPSLQSNLIFVKRRSRAVQESTKLLYTSAPGDIYNVILYLTQHFTDQDP